MRHELERYLWTRRASSATRSSAMRPPTSILVVLLLIAVGCPRGIEPPEAAIPGTFSNRGRIEAMLSIHAHYLWPDGRFPSDVRPMPLRDAARYLFSDPDPMARSRQRRAIARLAAVGLERREFRAAIRELGADPDQIEAQIEHQEEITGQPLSLTATEAFVCNLFRDRTKDVCDYECLDQELSPPGAPTASYLMKIRVVRSWKEVAKSIDPQTWDHCSKFYCPPQNTFLAHKDTSGNIVHDPGLPYGTAYTLRSVYEHFSCPLKDCGNATFDMLLNVTTSSPTNAYQVLYGRNEYLGGKVDGWDPAAVNVLVDYGQLSATEDIVAGSAGTIVYADKTLALGSSLLTGIYHGALRLIEAELSGELAEMACCQITDIVPTKCP